MKVHVFHHYDLDGYGAASVINRYLYPTLQSNFGIEDILFITCYHNSIMDFSMVEKDDFVFILDYSFIDHDKPNIIKLYEEVTKNIVWIDHHKTSDDIIKENKIFEKMAANGIVETSNRYSGCLLTYIWTIKLLESIKAIGCCKCNHLIPYITFDKNDVLNDTEEYLYNTCPEWVQLVSDYDTFRHKIPGSVAYNAGAYSIGLFKYFLDDGFEFERPSINSIIDRGNIILEYQDLTNKKLIKNNSFKTKLILHMKDGTVLKKEIICVNGNVNSMTFGEKYDEFDAVCIFNFDGVNYKYSMFSKKDGGMDCSLVAKYYNAKYKLNGGGHLHAAGWSTTEVVFKKNWIVHIYENTLL